jgi:hypothetical protein
MRESRNDEFDRRLALITLHETPHLPVIGRACREAKNGFCHDQMSGDGASYCDRHSSRLGNLPIYAGFLREGSLSDLSKAARVVRAARVGIGIGCLTARQPRSCINQPQKLASTTAKLQRHARHWDAPLGPGFPQRSSLTAGPIEYPSERHQLCDPRNAQAAASRLRRPASRRSASDNHLGSGGRNGWTDGVGLDEAELRAEAPGESCAAGGVLASTVRASVGVASSASLAFAAASSSAVTVPTGLPSTATRAPRPTTRGDSWACSCKLEARTSTRGAGPYRRVRRLSRHGCRP